MTTHDAGSAAYRLLLQAIDPQSTLRSTRELKGGVSAQVTLLEVERPNGKMDRMIVRRHGARDLARNPQIATDEFKLLQILQAAGIAAPAPLYLDHSSRFFSSPCIVVEYVEGETDFAPGNQAGFILQAAAQLVKIHSVDCATHDLSFLPKRTSAFAELWRELPAGVTHLPAGTRVPELLASTTDTAMNPPALLHGDFWPGNLVWRDGQLVAVIDWEDAALGDPLADLANSRLEMLWALGVDAMHDFTHQVESLVQHTSAPINFTHLPVWDLWAGLRTGANIASWGLEAASERIMRERHSWFLNQAIERLST